MVKKDFTKGIQGLLKSQATKPTKSKSATAKISDQNENWTIASNPQAVCKQASFMLPEALLSKARTIAQLEQVAYKEVIVQALATFITAWEDKQGKVLTYKPIVSNKQRKLILT